MNNTPFRWRKARSSKIEGYGNRHQLFCRGCGHLIYDGDFGNPNGRRYMMIYATESAKSHFLRCTRIQRKFPLHLKLCNKP